MAANTIERAPNPFYRSFETNPMDTDAHGGVMMSDPGSPQIHCADPPRVEVRSSPISGKGLYALETFRDDDAILIISGELIDGGEARRRHEEGNCYIFFMNDELFIDPPPGALARYANHSCRPNAIPVTLDDRTLYLCAMRDIDVGEEITIDYDFPEIYDMCHQTNPLCLQAKCPMNPR